MVSFAGAGHHQAGSGLVSGPQRETASIPDNVPSAARVLRAMHGLPFRYPRHQQSLPVLRYYLRYV